MATSLVYFNENKTLCYNSSVYYLNAHIDVLHALNTIHNFKHANRKGRLTQNTVGHTVPIRFTRLYTD